MAFQKLVERRKQRAQYRIACSLTKGGENLYGLRLVIGGGIVSEYRLHAGERVEALWGTGEDFPWVALSPAQSGGRKLTKQGSGLVTDFRVLPLGEMVDAEGQRWRLQQRKQPATDCPHKKFPNGQLAVKLPDEWWVKANWGEVEKLRRPA